MTLIEFATALEAKRHALQEVRLPVAMEMRLL